MASSRSLTRIGWAVFYGLSVWWLMERSEAAGMASVDKTSEVATVAGGCFWGVEEILRKVPGILETRVGYTGGFLKSPNYEAVKKGATGHAEAVEIKLRRRQFRMPKY